MYSTKNKNNSKKLKIILPVVLVAVVAIGVLGIALKNSRPSSAPKIETTQPEAKVNLNPVTEEETKVADANKEQIVAKEEAQKSLPESSASTPAPSNATITIVDSNASSVKLYVQGVFENGGTCTAVATKGSEAFTKSSEGFKNVSYTQCSPINWNKDLTAGTWNVAVSYKSVSTQASASTETIVK